MKDNIRFSRQWVVLFSLSVCLAVNAFANSAAPAAGDKSAPLAEPLATALILAPPTNDPPEILVQPAPQTVPEGGTLTLAVIAASDFPDTFHWTLDGKKIAGATNATLTITNIHPWQAGDYAVTIDSAGGDATSANALVAVDSETILIYDFAAHDSYVSGGARVVQDYAGRFYYQPASSNGVFVAWGTVDGEKEYWSGDFDEDTLYTIGSGNETWSVFGLASEGFDTNDLPTFMSTVYQGQNEKLTVATSEFFFFPRVFTGEVTDIYTDPTTSNSVLYHSQSTCHYAPVDTQVANNRGKTLVDLENGLINALTAEGYRD